MFSSKNCWLCPRICGREQGQTAPPLPLTLKGHSTAYAREANVCSLPQVLLRVKAECTQRGLRSVACVRVEPTCPAEALCAPGRSPPSLRFCISRPGSRGYMASEDWSREPRGAYSQDPGWVPENAPPAFRSCSWLLINPSFRGLSLLAQIPVSFRRFRVSWGQEPRLSLLFPHGTLLERHPAGCWVNEWMNEWMRLYQRKQFSGFFPNWQQTPGPSLESLHSGSAAHLKSEFP